MTKQLKKFLYTLLTALAVGPLMATSDSPSSSSSSSSLTANMSDAAEPTRAKRKAVGPSYEEDEAEERSLMHAQKTLRSSNSPFVFSMADDSGLPEHASSSALRTHNSLAAPLYTSAPIAPIIRAGNIPAWFYAGQQSLLKITFEYLNYADLTLARRVSKAFHTMAPQIVMPSGQRWVAWCIDKMEKGKNQTQALKEIISATGRCPNAHANLRQIVEGYFQHVPAELRFWDLDPKNKPVINSDKDELRTSLGKIIDRLTSLEVEHYKARETVKQQAPQSTVEKDLEALIEQQEKDIAPLKGESQRIIDLLVPALNALFPYELANTILSELDIDTFLPEHLPLIPKSLVLNNLGISALAKKRNIIRGFSSCLAAACLPSVHASLFALNNNIICLDKARREALQHVEKRFRYKLSVHEFDPIISLHTDLLDLEYYQIKLEQLRLALKNVILKDRSIQRNTIELNLWAMESEHRKFIHDRIDKYLAALKRLEQTQRSAITNHVLKLIKMVFDVTPDTEVEACRLCVKTIINLWSEFLQKNSTSNYKSRAAHFAARAVALAGNRLEANDLRFAAMLHFTDGAFSEAEQYFDHLLAEFKDKVNFLDFILAARSSTLIAACSDNHAEAERHLNVAAEKFTNAMEKLHLASWTEIKRSSQEIALLISHLAIQGPQLRAFADQMQEYLTIIDAKIASARGLISL